MHWLWIRLQGWQFGTPTFSDSYGWSGQIPYSNPCWSFGVWAAQWDWWAYHTFYHWFICSRYVLLFAQSPGYVWAIQEIRRRNWQACTYLQAVLSWIAKSKSCFTSFDPVTNLPYLHCFKSVDKTALILTMKGCITSEHNQNLSYLQKVLLQWHFKLGHCGFTMVKWLGATGLFRALGVKMSREGVQISKCAAC